MVDIIPAFFHAEKQALYSVCKDMLDGLGLDQVVGCAGLSESQVKNFLSYAHARNNRAVLFNLTCGMKINLADMAVTEDANVSITVKRLHERVTHNSKTTDADLCLDVSGPVGSHARNDCSTIVVQ